MSGDSSEKYQSGPITINSGTAALEEAQQQQQGKALGLEQQQDNKLDVVYSDDDIVVLDKPSGLRTVPGKVVGPEAKTKAHVEWHSGTKRQRQEFWTDVVHNACESLLHDEVTKQDEEFRSHLRRLTRENNVPRKRTKFENYTAVTLGLQGEEGEKVSGRIWDAVDNRLKLEVGPGVDCLLTRVKSRWPDVRHVHRLDQDTSGLIVMALTPEAAKELCRQFRERVPSKTYTAVVEGKMGKVPKNGEVVAKIRPDVDNRPRQMFDEEGGNEAKTRWRRIKREADRTRVDFNPVTGRTHQVEIISDNSFYADLDFMERCEWIYESLEPERDDQPSLLLDDVEMLYGKIIMIRMHALSLGHPILGDSLYGTDEGKEKSDRLLLHARLLSFLHPRTGDKVEFERPPPF